MVHHVLNPKLPLHLLDHQPQLQGSFFHCLKGIDRPVATLLQPSDHGESPFSQVVVVIHHFVVLGELRWKAGGHGRQTEPAAGGWSGWRDGSQQIHRRSPRLRRAADRDSPLGPCRGRDRHPPRRVRHRYSLHFGHSSRGLLHTWLRVDWENGVGVGFSRGPMQTKTTSFTLFGFNVRPQHSSNNSQSCTLRCWKKTQQGTPGRVIKLLQRVRHLQEHHLACTADRGLGERAEQPRVHRSSATRKQRRAGSVLGHQVVGWRIPVAWRKFAVTQPRRLHLRRP
mmetsp:Transcript_38505/g.86468  ORF Transcript_38505/g.86468 Transcript_38505/m.86468 type:complete len:282 (+) Transcript_38505:1412-2257(+)